jgi:HK97 family phage major capsid protein
MSMKLFELKQQQHFALNKAESIVQAAENAQRELTKTEEQEYAVCMTTVRTLGPQIKAIEDKNTIRGNFPNGMALIVDGGRRHVKQPQKLLTADYANEFYDYVASNGQKIGAAMYEGSGPAGGYIVPLTVDQQVVPLAPTDMGVREVATVIPTVMDIKIPRATTISTASGKLEGTGSGSGVNLFTESEPVLDQFTLSAYMAGLQHIISWELAQDVPSFQSFAVGDMLLAQSLYEENLFVNGTGTGQAQGLIGNTGVGITAATADSNGNLLSIDATFDVMGTLKTPYHRNASWLLQRATAVEIRKAQKQSNLFEPVFTREGVDRLHGYPVTYSTAMPAIAAGATPVLFGDFKLGYVIGDRGGSGISVKILDQPRATEGLIVLLAYRRTDGRVRRSEALQAITLHS